MEKVHYLQNVIKKLENERLQIDAKIKIVREAIINIENTKFNNKE